MAGNKWKARRAEVEALRAEGRSSADIAAYFKVSIARLSMVEKQYRADDAKATDARDMAERLRYAADVLEKGLP